MSDQLKYMKWERNLMFWLLVTISVLAIGIFMISYVEYKELFDDYKELETTFELYQYKKWNFTNRHYSKGITGLYVGDYFLVWAEGRTYSEVIETCNHEYLHHKYRNKWEHFVEEGGLIQYERKTN